MYLKNKMVKQTNMKEIILSSDKTIHTDCRGIVDGFRLIFSNSDLFPQSIEKQGYWYTNEKYKGQMYSLYLSKLTNDWWLHLFPQGWGNMRAPYYSIDSNKQCTEHYGLDRYPISLRDIEGLIFEVVEQLHEFNLRHSVDIYKDDIDLLREYISKHQNEILGMNLNKKKMSFKDK